MHTICRLLEKYCVLLLTQRSHRVPWSGFSAWQPLTIYGATIRYRCQQKRNGEPQYLRTGAARDDRLTMLSGVQGQLSDSLKQRHGQFEYGVASYWKWSNVLYVLFLYGGNVRICLRAVAAWQLPGMSELLHVLEPIFYCRRLLANPPRAIMPSFLTTRPCPVHVRQKPTGASCLMFHMRHNSEQTLSRNDSSLNCLQLALVYRYHLGVMETWEHVSVHWQQCNFHLLSNCFTCWNPDSIAGLRVALCMCVCVCVSAGEMYVRKIPWQRQTNRQREGVAGGNVFN